MKISQLKTFYHVAQCKSLLQAAEQLHVSQSALSRQIKALEEDLEVQLIHRLPRGFILTKEGEMLYREAEEIFGRLNELKKNIKSEETGLQGLLKVSAASGLANFFIVPHLPPFLKEHPDLRLALITSDTPPDFSITDFEVAIRPYIPNKPHLIQNFLMRNHVKLYASPEYLKKFGTPKQPEDLDNHRLIAFGLNIESAFSNMNWHLTLGTKPGEIREPYLQINSPQARCEMAAAGLGITTISKEHPDLNKMNLVEVLPHIEGPAVDNYYIYPSHLKNSTAIQLFEKYLQEIFASSPKKE